MFVAFSMYIIASKAAESSPIASFGEQHTSNQQLRWTAPAILDSGVEKNGYLSCSASILWHGKWPWEAQAALTRDGASFYLDPYNARLNHKLLLPDCRLLQPAACSISRPRLVDSPWKQSCAPPCQWRPTAGLGKARSIECLLMVFWSVTCIATCRKRR